MYKNAFLNTVITTFIFLIVWPMMLPVRLQAQSEEGSDEIELVFDPLVDNIQDKLPPLEVLIDSAIVNAPKIRMEEAEISLARYRLIEAKKTWTSNFGVQSSFNYGNRYQFSTSETAGGFPTEFITTGNQTYLSVGVYLKMPLFAIINRGNAINLSKRDIETHMIKREQMVRETKQAVIFTYQNLLLHQDLLKVKNEAQVTSSIQVKMAEKEFLNGKISISELARLTQNHSTNVYNFKKDRALFYRQYLILEQLVGMKFNLLNEIY